MLGGAELADPALCNDDERDRPNSTPCEDACNCGFSHAKPCRLGSSPLRLGLMPFCHAEYVTPARLNA